MDKQNIVVMVNNDSAITLSHGCIRVKKINIKIIKKEYFKVNGYSLSS